MVVWAQIVLNHGELSSNCLSHCHLWGADLSYAALIHAHMSSFDENHLNEDFSKKMREKIFCLVLPLQCTGPKIFWADPNVLCQNKRWSPFITLMPCPFTGPKMFCAGPNILSQHKNLTAFSASSKTYVPAQKSILLNANNLLVRHKMFVTAKICK